MVTEKPLNASFKRCDMNSWVMRIVLNVLVNNMDKDLVKALAMATSAGVTLVSCIGGFYLARL